MKRVIIRSFALLAVVIFVVLYCGLGGSIGADEGDKATDKKEWTCVVSEKRIGSLKGGILSSIVVSPDSRHLALIVSRDVQVAVVVDRKEGKRYTGIGKNSIVFSPDSKRVAYVAYHDGKVFVVDGEKEGKRYDNIGSDTLRFSPDSQRLAYQAREGKKCVVVADDKEGPKYDGVGTRGLFFSRDSKRMAYSALRGKKWVVVLDGKEGTEYVRVGKSGPVFSPDSKRFAYMADNGWKWSVIIDGKEKTGYDGIMQNGLSFSPDSKRFCYIAKQENKFVVFVGGKRGKSYDFIKATGVSFSPDSQHYAYIATDADGKRVLVVDGKETDHYDNIGHLCFSPDSNRIARVVLKDGKDHFLVDNEESPPYQAIVNTSPVFSPDSKRVTYSAMTKDKKWLVVVDGQKTITGVDGILRTTPIFSPDSSRVACGIYKNARFYVVVDGQTGKRYSQIADIAFSSDSMHLAYVGFWNNDAYVIVNGKQVVSMECGKKDEGFIRGSHLVFDKPNHLYTMGHRGANVFLIKITIQHK